MSWRAGILGALAALALPAVAAADLEGTPEVVVPSLATPWEVAAVPDGRLLVPERAGRVRIVAPNGDACATPAFTDPTPGITVHKFLGLALHPDWATNGLVYLYENYTESGVRRSRILRLFDNGSTLALDREIFDGIGSDGSHDGGRIAFGPDRKLYVTTGDIHNPALPRDQSKLNGKILRLEAPGNDADGQPVADNPWFAQGGDARFVYSKGHRHPQGLAWDDAGRLWETEHGPTGEGHAPAGKTQGHDELNLIVKGGDYGWPTVAGDDTEGGSIAPKAHSGAVAWAPGDVAFARDGSLYVPMLAGQHLRRFVMSGETVTSHAPVYSNYGRLRVGVADGGTFWFTQDGSGADLLRVGIDGPLPDLGTAGCGELGTGPDRPASPTAPAQGASGQGGGATGLPISTTPPSPALPASRAITVDSTSGLQRLLARVRDVLRRRGALSRLRRARLLTVRAGGLGPGKVVLRLKLRRGDRLTTVAQGSVSPRSRAAVTVRLRVSPRGRRLLRRASLRRLVVETAYQPANGPRVVRRLDVR